MKHFMKVYYAYTQLVPTDIYPVQYGEEQCESDYSFGPCVRSSYLIHYVYSGNGILKIDNTEYSVHKGQMFLIQPHQLAYYQADHDTPWLYRWIEFNGSMVQPILKSINAYSNPIILDDEHNSIGIALLDIIKNGDMRFEALMQKFWAFITALTDNAEAMRLSSVQEYIQKSENFIKINIHKKTTVQDVAEYVGVNRSYLTRLFKQHKNTSPQQYILSLKMNTAAQYMKNTDISIKEVAQSVGYDDPHVFNRAFKKKFNSSPSEWRNKQIWDRFII